MSVFNLAIIRGWTYAGALSPWVIWCVVLLSLLTVDVVLKGVFCGTVFVFVYGPVLFGYQW
jgi:hypothetical protein